MAEDGADPGPETAGGHGPDPDRTVGHAARPATGPWNVDGRPAMETTVGGPRRPVTDPGLAAVTAVDGTSRTQDPGHVLKG